MSWSMTYPNRKAFADDQPSTTSGVEEGNQEIADQVDAAREAARGILESGAVGDASHDVVVTLHGHANPGHAPRKGWANDTVGVSISATGTPADATGT